MFEFETKIRYSETTSDGELSMLALLNYFQDSSILHSELLGVGGRFLTGLDMFWALSSWQIVVKRFPMCFEDVTVGTSPYDFKGFIGYRNFWMKDKNGEMIAWANSVWSLVGISDGKPRICSDDMKEKYALSPKLEMDYAPRHITFEGEKTTEDVIVVAKQHLDTNHHVNNGQYVNMALDFLPMDCKVTELRVEYKMQALLGTKMYPQVYRSSDKIGVSLTDENEKPYCNIEFTVKNGNT